MQGAKRKTGALVTLKKRGPIPASTTYREIRKGGRDQTSLERKQAVELSGKKLPVKFSSREGGGVRKLTRTDGKSKSAKKIAVSNGAKNREGKRCIDHGANYSTPLITFGKELGGDSRTDWTARRKTIC